MNTQNNGKCEHLNTSRRTKLMKLLATTSYTAGYKVKVCKRINKKCHRIIGSYQSPQIPYVHDNNILITEIQGETKGTTHVFHHTFLVVIVTLIQLSCKEVGRFLLNFFFFSKMLYLHFDCKIVNTSDCNGSISQLL